MKQRSYTADTPGLSALLLCDIVTQRGNVVNEEISKGYWSKGTSDKYWTVIRKWDFCCEETVSDNDTSGKAARSEKMVKYQWSCYPTATCRIIYKINKGGKMNSTKLLRYSMQLSMLKQLRTLKLINENEYRLIEKKLKKDYGVISNITAWLAQSCVVE